MPKRKQYWKVTLSCNTCDKIIVAICEESKIDEMKRRALKSIADFVNLDRDDHLFNITAEMTNELPEVGTDLVIKPKEMPEQPVEEDIVVAKLI